MKTVYTKRIKSWIKLFNEKRYSTTAVRKGVFGEKTTKSGSFWCLISQLYKATIMFKKQLENLLTLF